MTFNLDILQKLKQRVVDFYLDSSDFNGISFNKLEDEFGKNINASIINLAENNIIDVYFDDNPHIMRIPLDYSKTLSELKNKISKGEKSREITKISDCLIEIDSFNCCLYPSEDLIKEFIGSRFIDRPYSRELALKRYHFTYKFFDRSFLIEVYQDPRYEINVSDFQGSLYFSGEDVNSKYYIEHFYFGIPNNTVSFQRPIAISLRDLHKLNGKEQQRFKYYELEKQQEYKIHPVSEKIIHGLVTSYTTIFSSLLIEIQNLNKIFTTEYNLKIFKDDYADKNSSKSKSFYREYDYLNIPTEKAYNSFVQCLCKLIFDNLNGDLLEKMAEEHFIDLKNEDKTKSYYTLFLDCLGQINPQLSENFKTFIKKEIKPARNKHAHTFIDDNHNFKYLKDQIDIMVKLLSLVANLRISFAKRYNFSNPEITKFNARTVFTL